MILKQIEDEFGIIGYAVLGSQTYKISKAYIENLADLGVFLNKLNSAVTGTLQENDREILDSYGNKSLDEINKDLAYLSFSVFSADNIDAKDDSLCITTRKYSSDGCKLSCQEQVHILENIKPLINNEIVVKQASIQGSFIIADVEELGNSSPFVPVVEYQMIIKLSDKTVTYFNYVSDTKNSLIELAYYDGCICIANRNTRKILHPIVHADITESLDYIVETDIGSVAILSSTFSGKDSVVYKVNIKYMAENKEEILLLSSFYKEGDYVKLLKKAVSGTLVVANGQTMIANKVYDQAHILKNMLRGSAS